MTTTQAPAYRPPLSQRINFRMIFFFGFILLIAGSLAYLYFESILTGGVINHGDYLEVDLKAMSNFPFDQKNGTVTDIPKQWRDLDGKRVMVEGEMWTPYSSAPEQGHFQVVYSIAKCCFNGVPQKQHFVDSKVANGGKVEVVSGLVRFWGTLHVNVTYDDQGVSGVYSLDVDKSQSVQ